MYPSQHAAGTTPSALFPGEFVKVADFRSRALESLVGAAGGGALGAVAGAVSYAGNSPIEWLDANDEVQRRGLTSEEVSGRLRRALIAGALGASLGAGSALATSGLRRMSMEAADRAAVPGVRDTYLHKYRGLASSSAEDLRRLQEIQSVTGGGGSVIDAAVARADAADTLLKMREADITRMSQAADNLRRDSFFGGSSWGNVNGERVDIPYASTQRLTGEHFNALAKATNQPAYNLNTAGNVSMEDLQAVLRGSPVTAEEISKFLGK